MANYDILERDVAKVPVILLAVPLYDKVTQVLSGVKNTVSPLVLPLI